METLSPLLIVIVAADSSYLEKLPCRLDAQGTLFSDFWRSSLGPHAEEVMVLLIAHPSGYYLRPWHPESDPLRYARLFPAWLHTDLGVLRSLTRRIENNPAEEAYQHVVVPHLKRIINSFGNIVVRAGERGLSIDTFKKMYHSTVDVIVKDLEHLKFDAPADMLRLLFEPERQRAKPPSSLDPLLRKGLAVYSHWLCTGNFESKRYGDRGFHGSAVRKAQDVARIIPPKGPYVIVSIGGADGTELFTLGRLTGSFKGVLLEKSKESVRHAEEEAKRLNFELVPITGDAMEGLEEAMTAASRLSTNAGGLPILVTIMALLHELASRPSSSGFDLLKFFSKLHKADLLIGREPIEPSTWRPQMLLSGHFTADTFCRFANGVVVAHFRKFHPGSDYPEVERIADRTVRGCRGIILETLVKAFYVDDLFYECQECFTSFEEEDIARALNCCFPTETHHVRSWPGPSMTIINEWERYGLRAQRADSSTGDPVGVPSSHLWYVVTRKDIQ